GSFDGQSLVWDVRTGKRLPQVDRPRYRFIGLAFSAGGRPLAGGQTRRGLLLRGVLTGKQPTPLVGHTHRPTAPAFPRGRGRVLTAGNDGSVRTWGLRGKELARQVGPTYHFRSPPSDAWAFSPRLDYLARAAWSGGVQVMDLKTGWEALAAWSNHDQGPT